MLHPQAVSDCDPGDGVVLLCSDGVVLLRPHADPHGFTYWASVLGISSM